MYKGNVKVGMKVVPFQKTAFGFKELEDSYSWNRVRGTDKPYLNVDMWDDDRSCWILSGDFFNACDFEPYIDEEKEVINNKKKPYHINNDATYCIVYKSLNDIIYKMSLSECRLNRLTGKIDNFNPNGMVVVATKDGLQIINIMQIVEMLIVEEK